MFLFPYVTCSRILPNMYAHLFTKMDSTVDACGYMSTQVVHPVFWPPRSLPAFVQTEKFSLTSGLVLLSLYFSIAQLLPLALSLECPGENKAAILLHLTNTSCSAQGPIDLLPCISCLSGIIVSCKEESKICLLLPGKMSVLRRQEKPSKVRTEVFGLWLLSRGLEGCWEWSVCYKNVLDLNPKDTSQFFSETKCHS